MATGRSPLLVYDVTHRLGYYLKTPPQHVYLHAGPRVGAERLRPGLDRHHRLDPENPNDLPTSLRTRLSPDQIENFLCVARRALHPGLWDWGRVDDEDHHRARWARTDEAEDVAGSIRHVLRCWPLAAQDPQAFKWAALALHAALQGACVCHLTTTFSPVGAVTKRNAAEWLDWSERSRNDPDAEPPSTYLMTLPDLLRTVRKPDTIGGGPPIPGLTIRDGELNWLLRFHEELRNQFVHFSPHGWSIEISGFPGLAELSARIIANVLGAGWAFRHKDPSWHLALKGDLEALARLS